jgi:hypothetical protein
MADQKPPALESFPHYQIVAKAKVNMADLDDDLKNMIADFIKRYHGFKLKWNEASERILMSTSNVITQNIVDYYVEDENQKVDIKPTSELTGEEIKEIVKEVKEGIKAEDNPPAPANEPPAPAPVNPPAGNPPAPAPPAPAAGEEAPKNKNEKILHDLFTEGKTEVTKAMLSPLGFDTDLISIRGGKVGKYQLKKEPSEPTYKLTKIN